MRKACVVSSFDMLNIADLDLLGQVSARCDEMVVAVLSDELVDRLHGRPAVVPEAERLELVRCLRATGEVRLVTSLDEFDVHPLFSDEEALAAHVDELLEPTRRSASPELLSALAHGHAEGGRG